MIHRGIDAEGDWIFGSGIQSFASGLDAVYLNIKTRIQSWRTDCFFAPEEGVDYNNFLDIGTKEFLDRDIIRIIQQSDGVIRTEEFTSELDRETRELQINAKIVTVYGTISIREAVA